MKFGKRFLSYQGNKDPSSFLDYKGLKQAIKADCEALDHVGSVFESVRCPEPVFRCTCRMCVVRALAVWLAASFATLSPCRHLIPNLQG